MESAPIIAGNGAFSKPMKASMSRIEVMGTLNSWMVPSLFVAVSQVENAVVRETLRAGKAFPDMVQVG